MSENHAAEDVSNDTAENPEDPRLVVLLRRSAWLALVSALGQRPYVEVADMIDEIAGQLRAQIADTPAETEARPN